MEKKFECGEMELKVDIATPAKLDGMVCITYKATCVDTC